MFVWFKHIQKTQPGSLSFPKPICCSYLPFYCTRGAPEASTGTSRSAAFLAKGQASFRVPSYVHNWSSSYSPRPSQLTATYALLMSTYESQKGRGTLTTAVLKLPGHLPGQLDMFILSSKYGAPLKMSAMFWSFQRCQWLKEGYSINEETKKIIVFFSSQTLD